MFPIRPFRRAVADPAALEGFVKRHAMPGLGAEPTFLLRLGRGPESVVDVHDGRGRALVAILTDACENSGDAAELVLLACRDRPLAGEVLAVSLDAALAEARRGPRSSLEIVLTALVRQHGALLASRGLAPRYEMTSLEQRFPFRPVQAGSGWRWSDATAAALPALAALSRAAFAGHPGVNFPPPDRGAEHTVGRVPPVRLLRHGSTLAGSVAVRVQPDGAGFVEIVQRHPDHAGRGLGPVLLSEALRLLGEAGCGSMRPSRTDARSPSTSGSASW